MFPSQFQKSATGLYTHLRPHNHRSQKRRLATQRRIQKDKGHSSTGGAEDWACTCVGTAGPARPHFSLPLALASAVFTSGLGLLSVARCRQALWFPPPLWVLVQQELTRVLLSRASPRPHACSARGQGREGGTGWLGVGARVPSHETGVQPSFSGTWDY